MSWVTNTMKLPRSWDAQLEIQNRNCTKRAFGYASCCDKTPARAAAIRDSMSNSFSDPKEALEVIDKDPIGIGLFIRSASIRLGVRAVQRQRKRANVRGWKSCRGGRCTTEARLPAAFRVGAVLGAWWMTRNTKSSLFCPAVPI